MTDANLGSVEPDFFLSVVKLCTSTDADTLCGWKKSQTTSLTGYTRRQDVTGTRRNQSEVSLKGGTEGRRRRNLKNLGSLRTLTRAIYPENLRIGRGEKGPREERGARKVSSPFRFSLLDHFPLPKTAEE